MRKVIQQHQSSDLYRTAKIADDYDRCRNTTTMQYQKLITDVYGKKYIDRDATVHRSCSNFFNTFTEQENQYLLGNGATWKNGAGDKLGADFDTKLQRVGKYALAGGVSFGFWNFDHVEVFPILEFAPIYDEENGALSAGVRFWQIDGGKPLRATLYEIDGHTNFLYASDQKAKVSAEWIRVSDGIYMMQKAPYKIKTRENALGGSEIYDGENYPAFPIVPCWGNQKKQSELIGLREKIDAYDFILNGWEDDLDQAQILWIISGAGGMDDPDLMQFLDRLRAVKAAAPADGQAVTPVTVQIPVEARSLLLTTLKKQLYEDAMAFNPDDVKSGSTVTAQIDAAYEPLDLKTTGFEYCILDFVSGIMKVAGIEDEATFTRSKISNATEQITTVISAARYLGSEYVTKKILTLLGDGDQAEEVLRAVDAENLERLGAFDEDVE